MMKLTPELEERWKMRSWREPDGFRRDLETGRVALVALIEYLPRRCPEWIECGRESDFDKQIRNDPNYRVIAVFRRRGMVAIRPSMPGSIYVRKLRDCGWMNS